jgi:hypothetical protein
MSVARRKASRSDFGGTALQSVGAALSSDVPRLDVTKRRSFAALLFLAAVTAAVAFLVPVHAAGFKNCGVAGPWVTAIGDPSGPTDPPGTYDEYNACRRAARPALVVMLSGLLAAGVAGILLGQERRKLR